MNSIRHTPSTALLILLLALASALAGCGSQATQTTAATVAIATATPLPPQTTVSPTDLPQPTLAPTTPTLELATETAPTPANPTAEIDLEARNYYYKGLTYIAAGLLEEALASFEQAITLAPGFDLAYLERGKLYMSQGQFSQARSDYHDALELTRDAEVKAEVNLLLQELATLTAAATAAPTPVPTLPPDQITATPAVLPTLVSAPSLTAQLNQEFALPLGHTAQLPEASLSLAFWAVLEDSRCPSRVNCVEAGQARIMIQAQQGNHEAMMIEMNTNPPLKRDVIGYAGYEIRLVGLEPYPEDVGQTIPPQAYEATFVVKTQ